MTSYYEVGDVEAALTARGSDKIMKKKRKLAVFSLMMSHIERCYAEAGQDKRMDETLAIEIYRTLNHHGQILTKGMRKAVTMVYQDLFRVKKGPDGVRTLHCLHRIGGFRFNRSISATNLRNYKKVDKPPGTNSLITKMAQRAVYFHKFMWENHSKYRGTLKGKEVVPLYAGIHKINDRANQARSDTEEEKIDATTSQEVVSITTGSTITPAKPVQETFPVLTLQPPRG